MSRLLKSEKRQAIRDSGKSKMRPPSKIFSLLNSARAFNLDPKPVQTQPKYIGNKFLFRLSTTSIKRFFPSLSSFFNNHLIQDKIFLDVRRRDWTLNSHTAVAGSNPGRTKTHHGFYFKTLGVGVYSLTCTNNDDDNNNVFIVIGSFSLSGFQS